MQKKILAIIFMILSLLILSGCSAPTAQAGAPQGVETYLKALVDRDENRVIAASCADWEAQAKVEYNSFSAVKLNLEGLSCQTTGQEEPYTLVQCKGSIVANYGAEDLTIDIANHIYKVIQEGGDWRMCGYSK